MRTQPLLKNIFSQFIQSFFLFYIHIVFITQLFSYTIALYLLVSPVLQFQLFFVFLLVFSIFYCSHLCFIYFSPIYTRIHPSLFVFSLSRIPSAAISPVAAALTISLERPAPSPAAKRFPIFVSILRLTCRCMA